MRVRRVDRVWWWMIFVRRFSLVLGFLGTAAQGVCGCFGVGFGYNEKRISVEVES